MLYTALCIAHFLVEFYETYTHTHRNIPHAWITYTWAHICTNIPQHTRNPNVHEYVHEHIPHTYIHIYIYACTHIVQGFIILTWSPTWMQHFIWVMHLPFPHPFIPPSKNHIQFTMSTALWQVPGTDGWVTCGPYPVGASVLLDMWQGWFQMCTVGIRYYNLGYHRSWARPEADGEKDCLSALAGDRSLGDSHSR